MKKMTIEEAEASDAYADMMADQLREEKYEKMMKVSEIGSEANK